MLLKDNTDEMELLLLLQGRDAKAFEKLYYRYSKMLYGSILKMVKSTDIAEEMLQDIFQRIWERSETIDVTKSFKSYLFTIAKHLVCDFFHKQTRQRKIEAYLIAVSSELYRHIDDEIAFKEADTIIVHAIHKLPPQRKLIYTLCKMDGKSYEEVGQLLGISTSTINDHIVKATKSIKAYYLSEHIVLVLLFMWLS